MWGAIFVFFVALITGTLMTQNSAATAADSQRAEAAAIAGSMQVYRNPVIAYAQANPSATGTLSDASLTLPTWYARLNGVSNYVNAGKGYVYYIGTSPELAYQVLKATNNSINVGINQGGNLVNPISSTNTTIPMTLPSAIPNGSVVIAP